MSLLNKSIRWLAIMVVFITGSATSCEDDYEYYRIYKPSPIWNVKNDFRSEVAMYTLYESDGKTVSARHLKSFVWLQPYELFCQKSTLNLSEELERTPGLCIQFGLTDTELSPEEFSNVMLAYITPDRDWLIEHNGIIHFPEDCTVNPDLWQLFDLDKFVELYGTLNAQGWDDVWTKWEQSNQ